MKPTFKEFTMQFLAIARPKADLLVDNLPPNYEELLHLEREKARAYYANETIRQIWHCADSPGVAIIFEAESIEHLQDISTTFPLVAANYLDILVVPLKPYEGFGSHQKPTDIAMIAH
jgi:muconolactone delta-isomerase